MSHDAKPVTIIMIEDDEGHARLIEKNIRRAGVNNEIIPFTNGTEALSYLFGPDGSGNVSAGRSLLVLLDLNLPDMTGVDILQKIKSNAHTKRSPVVVLTTRDISQGDLTIVRDFAGTGVPVHRGTPAGAVEDTRRT